MPFSPLPLENKPKINLKNRDIKYYSDKSGVFLGLLLCQVGVFLGLLLCQVGVFLGLFDFTPYIVFNYRVNFPTMIVVMPRVAKKYVDKSKRLKLMPDGRAEKTKNKKDRALLKKPKEAATMFLVFIYN